MTTQVERDFDFQACVHFQDNFLINFYDFTVLMDIDTGSIREQNVAMDRIKFSVYELFENSIFVNMTDTSAIEKYTAAGLRVCLIPDDPYDQIIALLLLLKFTAVCEDRIKVTDIKLTSKLSDEVKFIEQLETAQQAITMQGWWNESTPSICSKSQDKKSKIVKLIKDSWVDFDLGWKEKKSKTAEILFTIKPDKKP